MTEEQAFMLLCKLMEDPRYSLREMYKANFENLQVRFHQLTCLIQDNLPDLYLHFDDLKVECHMYASQWFLTLFTAKFPLYLVFRIMDIFLYEVSFSFKIFFRIISRKKKNSHFVSNVTYRQFLGPMGTSL